MTEVWAMPVFWLRPKPRPVEGGTVYVLPEDDEPEVTDDE